MKPSKIKALKAKKALLLFPGIRALTWKGTVYCKRKSDIELINATDDITSDFECHELIHVRQAESTKDSWFRFYALYLWYWIINSPLVITGIRMPYYFIPFELEAMNNEIFRKYPTSGAVYQWKDFKRIKFKDKYKLARRYNNLYKPKMISFKEFVRTVVRLSIENG